MDLSHKILAARTMGGELLRDVPVTRWESIGQMLDDRAVAFADQEYLVFYDRDGSRTVLTYAGFAKRVRQLAEWFIANGCLPDERIATVARNHADTVVQYFAAWYVGLTVVPVNVGEDDARIRYMLENSESRVVFVRTEYTERIDRIVKDMPRIPLRVSVADQTDNEQHGVDGWISYRDIFTNPSQSHAAFAFMGDPDQDALVVYTSGTTGNPKGVVLSHGNLLADSEGIAQWHGIDSNTRMMCVLPIHHVNGTVVTLITPMCSGASVVLLHKFSATKFFQRIADERVAIVSVVPTLLAFLVGANIDTSLLDLSVLRHIICGAGPLTCELARKFEGRYGVAIIHGYGLSETTCYSCFLPVGQSDDERHGWLFDHGFPSIGMPIPQNQMDIQDENGRSLAEAERGEIVIRGYNVMKGYYANKQANRDAFTHGWFRSGDEGFRLDSPSGNGSYYFITGRLKELIIRGGVNISPLEIDEVLNSHPGIDAAIAVGFENTWYGEEIGAYVRRSDPALTVEDVLAWCRRYLPSFKSPKVVVFGDDIPVTSTGKYQRNRVRDHFSDHRNEQFNG